MALPSAFASSLDYFEESLEFFKEYQYLYNFANTDALVKDVFSKIELDEQFDSEDGTNEFLSSFFVKLKRLEPIFERHNEVIEEDQFNIPLGPKKKHEIIHLAEEIKNVCMEGSCETVVDFGSGLGYLDQIIFEKTNFKVMGLECNNNHCLGAKERQIKYHKKSLNHVKYITHTITEESGPEISRLLQEHFNSNEKFCVSGLHACADLTPDAVNLFLKHNHAKCLVLMPCCYHKMASKENMFKNFPLSNCLKKIYEKYEGFKFLNVPFLRLAAQPYNSWSNIDYLVFSLMARAVLQLYAFKHNYKLKRKKRKAIKTKTLENNFESYLSNVATGFTLSTENHDNCKEVKIEFDLDELRTIWREISELTFKKAATLINLQNNLQPIIENFVLYDRLLYLQENGVNNCKFKKMFDQSLSPRCLALIAIK